MNNPKCEAINRSEAVINIKRDWYAAFGKRWFDTIVAFVALIVLLPVFGIAALAVLFTGSGGILLCQERVGRNRKHFTMLKFRTMRPEITHAATAQMATDLAAKGVLYKVPNDLRVTWPGRLLRRLSIDELPQLINVLKGEMSMVGPRPLLPFMVAPYPKVNCARTQVLPGLTGLWQISARGESSSVLQMIEYDLAYQQNLSFGNDIKILIKTIPIVLTGIGVK